MLKGFSLLGVGSKQPTHLQNCDMSCCKPPNVFSLHEAAAMRARQRASAARTSALDAGPVKNAPHDVPYDPPPVSAAAAATAMMAALNCDE
jgi:hypothetical protein|eukprot:1226148-Prymnesium_polylepis.1